MKRSHVLALLLLLFIFGCSQDNTQDPNLSLEPRGTPGSSCGSYVCNPLPNVNSSSYATLCQYQSALLSIMNNACTINYANPNCISTPGLNLPAPTWKYEKGSWITESWLNIGLLSAFYALASTNGAAYFPNGPICDVGVGIDGDPSECNSINIASISASGVCSANQTAGWTVSGTSISEYMNTAFQAACNYGKTQSCGLGYVFKPVKIEFIIASPTLCGGCNWLYCPASGLYYFSETSCEGYNIQFKVTYNCCSIQ